MLVQQYIDQEKVIQTNLLVFIDNETEIEENFGNLIKLFKDHNISENSMELQSILYLILQISNNHHRSQFFFNKIERLLLYFEDSIKQSFSNSLLFTFFLSNKRIILFLIKEKILILDKSIAKVIKKNMNNYASYLYPEMKPFFTQNEKVKYKINTENFEEKRMKGENDDYLCEIIQNDKIDEFITFVNKNSLSLSSKIKESIYETNNYLLSYKDNLSLIHYASFYGSTQIFKYLYLNGVKLEPSIWLFAIHGDNPELIHYLEEINYKMTEELSIQMINESIKCHHNEIVEYLLNNYSKCEINNEFIFKYANFLYFPSDLQIENNFFYLCQYNYIFLVSNLLKTVKLKKKTKSIDIAAKKGNIEIINILLKQKQEEKYEIDRFLFKNSPNLMLKEIFIPSSVSKIENFAFRGLKALREVLIPDSVVLIGKNAFNDCSKLKKISIPQSVIKIDDCAFSKCSMLKKIKIPSSVEFMGESIFRECNTLNKVSILSNLSEIQPYSFSGCKLLKEVEIPLSLTLIGKGAFSGCSSLEVISIPSSVALIQDFAFSGCSSLKSITIPPLIIKISAYTFSLCSSLRKVLFEKPSFVKVIEESAFRGCSSISVLPIPDSVVYIGDYAFKGCASLKKITTTDSLTYIGECAFKGCCLLSKILIPNSAEIGKDAFKDCKSIKS